MGSLQTQFLLFSKRGGISNYRSRTRPLLMKLSWKCVCLRYMCLSLGPWEMEVLPFKILPRALLLKVSRKEEGYIEKGEIVLFCFSQCKVCNTQFGNRLNDKLLAQITQLLYYSDGEPFQHECPNRDVFVYACAGVPETQRSAV